VKRSKPLKATKPLERRASLSRTSWMPTSTALSRRGRLRDVSMKRQALKPAEAVVREAVIRRDGGCLLRRQPLRLGSMASCFGRPTFHHLWKAGQGGAYTEDNGVCLCVMHNDAVEDDPPTARMLGLVVSRRYGINQVEAAARRQLHGLVP
jgi:hypothetical protein